MTDKNQPRIVLCGIGRYGSIVARIALENGYTIVAAFNREGAKVGKDLGQLVGLNRDIGIIVQDIDKADLKHLDADIGIVTQTNNLRENMSIYQRLMNAGINVLCLAMEAYYPYGSDPDAAEEIDALAKKNKVTFTGSGIHDMSRIWSGILAAGQCTHIKSISHESLTDNVGQATPEQLLRDFAVGWTVSKYMEVGIHKARLWAVYTDLVVHVLESLGFTVTYKRTEVEPIVGHKPYESDYLNCVIPSGNVLGTRTKGYIETKEGVIGHLLTEARMFDPGDEEHTLWNVEGSPRSRVRVKRIDSDYTNGACLFNRIKDVIAASAGIVPVSKLGPLHCADLLRGYH